jgi:hypothetical protein
MTVFQNAMVEEDKAIAEGSKEEGAGDDCWYDEEAELRYYTCRLVTAMSTTAVSLLLAPCDVEGAVSHRPVAEHVVLACVAFDGPCSASGMGPACALTQPRPKPKRVNDHSASS